MVTSVFLVRVGLRIEIWVSVHPDFFDVFEMNVLEGNVLAIVLYHLSETIHLHEFRV